MEKDFYELTNPQKSIWYTEEVFKGTPIANITATVIIPQKVDFKLLEKAINILVERADSFRLKITLKNDKTCQYVENYSEFPLEIINVTSEEDLQKKAREIADTPFEVFDSFLFDFRLVKFPDNHGGFIIRMNHLISDAWSGVFDASEIVRIYTALLTNEDISNIIYPSYTDYIKSEKEYMTSDKFNKDKTFWNNLFATVPETAMIPSSFPETQDFLGKSLRKQFSIPNKLITEISQFCKDSKISVFNFFMAIFSIYISKVTNLDEIVLGTPILNRSNVKEKHTSGMFVNTLPVKVSLKDIPTFTALASAISSNLFNIFKHQKYSYLTLLEDLRTQNHNTQNLYNVLISYQNVRSSTQDSKTPFDIEWLHANYISDSLDIHIFDMNDTGSFNLAYDYQLSKYTEQDILNIHDRILNMIHQVLNKNDISISELEIVTPAEKKQILKEFNNTKITYPKDKTVIELFEEQVKKTPNNVAIVFNNQKLTYKELNEKASSLAYYLQTHNVEPNSIVGIFLDKSLETIIAILAILKCGTIYMPIDINYPDIRINFMLEDSNVACILSSLHLKEKLKKHSNVVCIDLSNTDLYEQASRYVPITVTSDSSAYIMYTSGSTGNPKGVLVSNKNIVRLIKNTNFIKFEKQERILQTGSIVFDACTFEIWGALLNGFELYIIEKQNLLDPILLEKYLIDNKITVLWLTAPLFNQLSESNPAMFKTVRVLLTGGDVLSPKHINSVKKACPNLTVINGYGPTENTTFSTCFTIDKFYEKSIPIGFPIANSTCYVVSPSLNLLPVGVPGELLVGGDGVSNGYLNNPSYTSQKFIPNPFDDGILYKTGDLVKWLSNGSIDFIGRIDNQVKIRGFRVELNEITLKIQEYKNINECISVIKTINNEKVICSYFSAKEKIDTMELKNWLLDYLPPYSIPTYLVQLEALPINANGKVDMKLLPEPQLANKKANVVLPRNSIDEKLIKILNNILNVSNISMDDNFFELGGDSLSCIHLCAQIQSEFKVRLLVKNVLDNPVLQNLSDIIEKNLNTSENNALKPVKKMDFYPLSSAQKRMYLSSTIAGKNSILYNIPGGIILDKVPDITKLEKCLNTLIERHEALRTYFTVEDNNIVQKISASVDFKLEISKDTISYNKLDAEFKAFVRPFDLSKSPLFRAKLIRLTKHRAALLVDMHHIISDGTSLHIFINELCNLYNDKELTPLDISYKDFAVWENKNLSSKNFKAHEDFWLNQFSDDIPVLNMPTSYPRPVNKSFKGNKVHFSADLITTDKINSLANKLGITPYMILLSSYYVLLKKYTSQEDIIIGTPTVGRNVADLYNVIGMFVNTLPLRISINGKNSFKEFLETVKETCLNCFEHQEYPFDELVAKLNLPRDNGRNPLFDTMFIYQNNGLEKVDFFGINSKYYMPDTNISKFDLSLEVIPNDKGLDFSFEYSCDLFNHEFIKNMSLHYMNILNAILKDESIKISDIDILLPEEKKKLLHNFNDTNCNFNKTKTITELFELQVKKTPKKNAIVFENNKLTYAKLNEKSNSLAHYLIKKGIKKNDVIGIMENRSLEMIISIIAVLKAGGTYILIDNTLPAHRVKYMLTNSNATLLLIDKDYSIDFNNQFNITNFDYSKNIANVKNTNRLFDSFAIIYTSGSTGNPKGVLLDQKGLINLVYSFDKIMKISSTSSHLGMSAVSFDMFAVELYTSILLGRTLYLLNDEEIKNPVLMSKIIIDNKVEFLITTPTKIELLLSNNDTAKCLKTLKGFQLGGEVFSASLYDKLSKYTNAKIYNGYGPTEITACCSNKLINSKNSINIGKPIPNTEIYILDNDMSLCPINIPGELCVAGKGVSLGYINDNAKTSKSFVNVKFTNKKLYKTGDIAKYLPSGEIEYIGRNDFQVKLNGLRIELSEIEKKLLSIKEIDNCVVLCDETKTFLKAFFTSSEKLNIPAIRKKLLESLPCYMVPKYIFQIEAIPITANGKVNRKLLDEYKISVADDSSSFAEPETPTQKLFCKIWEGILETKVGIDSDLFELGADSLSAIKFKIEALNNNIDVPYADIFKFKTIRKLAGSHIEENVTTPLENFTYDNINDVLKNNKKQRKYKVEKCTNNNVLLFGSNGFVGMHIIDSFIKNDSGTIYCIMRDKSGKGALNRFLEVLHFYFGKTLDKYIDNRIIVLKGDIVKENLGLSNKSYEEVIKNVSIIINAAANVKHFGNFDKFKNINIDATAQTIEFCKKYSKRLIHLSTLSVSGNMFLDGTVSHDTLSNRPKAYFAENNLFINQSLDNVYTRSKFEAEKIVLDSISEGLDAQILRLGNITSREADGKFQINPESNAFVNRLKAFVSLGVFPKSLLKQEIEFTPVDKCSDAIIKIIQNKCKNISILHVYNRNHTNVEKIFKVLKTFNFSLKAFNDADFSEFINKNLSNKSFKKDISGIVNDLNLDKKLSYTSNISIKSDFSVDFLLHCNFKWNKINENYIVKYITYLKSIGYLDKEETYDIPS